MPSMEPWPFSHGNLQFSKDTGIAAKPSMEPWPFSHGNAAVPALFGPGRIILQWSHGPLAMETSLPAPDAAQSAALQWSHGPLAMETSRLS